MTSETKAPEKMTARQALEAYGFVNDNGTYYKPTNPESQRWQSVSGGWRMLEVPTAALGAVDAANAAERAEAQAAAGPWGRPYLNTGFIEVPYRQKDGEWADVSGLHPAKHPQAFEWAWPEEKVAEIYAFGHTSDYGKPMRRNAEGELVVDEERSLKDASIPRRSERGDSK